MDSVTQGLGASYGNAIFDPEAPWWRTVGGKRQQPRLNPNRGGGRRLRHPFYAPIVYPRLPDRTLNFGDDVMARTRTVVTKTLDSAAIDHFRDPLSATIVTEVWGISGQQGLSTLSSFFRQLYRYRTDILPVGQYLGWIPADLSPKRYFIQLMDVRTGQAEDYIWNELGDERPYYIDQQLSVSFKIVREAKAPAGVTWFEGL